MCRFIVSAVTDARCCVVSLFQLWLTPDVSFHCFSCDWRPMFWFFSGFSCDWRPMFWCFSGFSCDWRPMLCRLIVSAVTDARCCVVSLFQLRLTPDVVSFHCFSNDWRPMLWRLIVSAVTDARCCDVSLFQLWLTPDVLSFQWFQLWLTPDVFDYISQRSIHSAWYHFQYPHIIHGRQWAFFFCIWDTGIRIQDAVFVDKVRGTKIKCLY